MSKCQIVNCFEDKVKDSAFCPRHYADFHSTHDPLVTHIGRSMSGYVKYKGTVHEAYQDPNADSFILTRFDSNGQSLIVPRGSEHFSYASEEDEDRYMKERDEYFRMRTGVNPAPEPDTGSFEGQLGQVLAEMEELLLKKNKDYGSSYDKTVEELGETVILIRIMDKFNRLKQLIKSGDAPEVEETIEETLSDLVGYGIIELVRRRRS